MCQQSIEKKLSDKDFSFNGATGKIQFQDVRDSGIHLLAIQEPQSGERRKFSTLPPDVTTNRCDK